MPSNNWSIRGARREFKGRYEHAISEYASVADLCDQLRAAAKTNRASLMAMPTEIVWHILSFVLPKSVESRDLVNVCWNPLTVLESDPRFRIAVRKRPLWAWEVSRSGVDAFDSLTVAPPLKRCVLHDARLDRSHQTFCIHREYSLDGHYSDSATNQDVFDSEVEPLLAHAVSGGRATFVCFGQTGTGKTYTVHGVQLAIAAALFSDTSSISASPRCSERINCFEERASGGEIDDDSSSALAEAPLRESPLLESAKEDKGSVGGSIVPSPACRLPQGTVVDVSAFELRGRQARDLLANGKPVKLLQDGAGDVRVQGGATIRCFTAAQLTEVLDQAHSLRSTAATERNAQSSRSHAIVTLEIVRLPTAVDTTEGDENTATTTAAATAAAAAAAATACTSNALPESLSAGAEGAKQGARGGGGARVVEGTLRLVDLAGSERNEDSLQHRGAEMTRESSSINESLAALKDCFRAITEKDVEQEVVVELRTLNGVLLSERRLAAGALNHGNQPIAASPNVADEPKVGVVERVVVRDKDGGHVKALRMPFRNHALTLYLKDAFTNPNHQTRVLACVSPTPADVEHTRRTLEMVCAMRAPPEQSMRSTRVGAAATPMERAKLVPLSKWPSTRVAEWCAAFNEQHCAGAIRAAAAAAKEANAQPRHKQQKAATAAARSPQSARRAESGPKPWLVKTKSAAATPKPWHKSPSPATSGESADSSGSGSTEAAKEKNLDSSKAESAHESGPSPIPAPSVAPLETTPPTIPPSPAPVPPSSVLPAVAVPSVTRDLAADGTTATDANTTATTTAAAPAAEPRLTYLKLPRHTDGKALVKLTAARLTNYCQGDAALGQQVYDAVREELKATSDARDSKRRRWQELLYGQAQYLPRPGDPPAAPPPTSPRGEGGGGGAGGEGVSTIPEESSAASADN